MRVVCGTSIQWGSEDGERAESALRKGVGVVRANEAEREDRETTPKPSRKFASVTLVVDPDSKKTRRRRDTEKGKEKDTEGGTVHLRFHITKVNKVQVRRQQLLQLLRAQARPGRQALAQPRPRDLGNTRPRFHAVFKIGRMSSRIYRSCTLWRVGCRARHSLY